MIVRFLKLELKQYFRSSYWKKGIILKLIMSFFILWILALFLIIGVNSYSTLKKVYPKQDPLQTVNSFLLFIILGDLIFRYLMQKLPVMNIKPLLLLPIKKDKLIHYILVKSIFSVFNFLSLFFYVPFAIVLIHEGYDFISVLGWLMAMLFIIQATNFLNFLVTKNNTIFTLIAVLLISLLALQNLTNFDISFYSKQTFNTIITNPILFLIPAAISLAFYYLNFKTLRNRIYLDDPISVKTTKANTSDLSFTEKFGDIAPFIKNDIRLIQRNKRAKTLLLISIGHVFFGVFFFKDSSLINNEFPFLVFASLFITGGFTQNYGQFIPTWDSQHFNMLMTQDISYKKYLNSKWYLMAIITCLLYCMSIPYLYFGLNNFLMISAGTIFNIGFNSLILLYFGSFNRKRLNLNNGLFGNSQGTSITQYLIQTLLIALPMSLFFIFDKFIGRNSGFVAIALVGGIGFIFKNYFMNLIVNKYIKDKYTMINAFKKEI